MRTAGFAALMALIGLPIVAQTQTPLNLVLPTENDAIFRGDGEAFYQYIERDYQGVKSTPWEGGRYGFVRNPVETGSGIVYTRLHEGIDIRPLQRDAQGEPLDAVRAIAGGTVVHTNTVPGFSNYGRYVVVEHNFDGCKYYSLYGHLSSIAVHTGQKVQPRDQLGVMGHTGEGLNQARAHVHLELNLLLSRHFEAWHDNFFKNDPNHNGLYNGLNLAGLDIARLYLALQKQPGLTIPQFLAEEETLYRVLVPASKNFDLAKLYPWMVRQKAEGEQGSWEISFNRAGVPLKVQANPKVVPEPELSYLKPGGVNSGLLTNERLSGRGASAHLTEKGKQFMRLLTFPD
ncbi:MAG TPA: M23 family metallopeptidase [Chthoniobacterales bacterium]|nr:M23 family metallopeptidase [Chthoniobacterales bacterium]